MNRLLFLLTLTVWAQSRESFEGFRFLVPKGWKVERTAESVVLKKDNGRKYCNSYLFRMTASAGSPESDFSAAWQLHAAKQGLMKPEKVVKELRDGWEVTTGAGNATFQNQPFLIVLSTRTRAGMTYSILHYMNDPEFGAEFAEITNSVTAAAPAQAPVSAPATASRPAAGGGMRMAKATTDFDDGWVATPTAEYVQVSKAGTEVRLYYLNDGLEKSRGNTTGPADFYWAQVVGRAFRTGAAQKYEGVNYPPIYFVEGSGQDPRTGQTRYVAMKVIYAGGARVVVVSSPSQAAYRQLFGHPNDLDRMLNYNKFGVTAADLTGTWVRNAGGGVEYNNAYTGNYAGMSANSTSDEFEFRADGSYRSTHRYANTNNGATKFNGLDYQGKYSVTDWEVVATNRVEGKPKKFWARLEAIQNGYLLILTDSDYESLQYVLYRRR